MIIDAEELFPDAFSAFFSQRFSIRILNCDSHNVHDLENCLYEEKG